MTRFLYCLWLTAAAPLMALATVLTAVCTSVGCVWGRASVWGYYPPMMWGRLMCLLALLPVRVEGRHRLSPGQSYVFVANHQGAYDIFLVYGFLGRKFRWMMKHELRAMPLIGYACQRAGHIFVDKRGPKAVQRTVEQAREVLRHGVSLFVFPEGARTWDGTMGTFHRGAFQLADELGLPVVPVTIEGSFEVLPRQRGFGFPTWHPLRLTIHQPIPHTDAGPQAVMRTMHQAKQVIEEALSGTNSAEN